MAAETEEHPTHLENNLNMLMQYPLKLEAIDEYGNRMADATGFLFRFRERLHLVTNWHVVSGRDAFDGTFLDKNNRMPMTLKVMMLLCLVTDDDLAPTISIPLELPLRREDESGARIPTWRQHPLGETVDVVAMDVDWEFRREWMLDHMRTPGYWNSPEGCYKSGNKPANERNDINPQGTSDAPFGFDSEVLIVGFPSLPLMPPRPSPMSKKGTVASPTRGLYEGGEELLLPGFYLDILTRPGFSGSPVFWRAAGALFQTPKTGGIGAFSTTSPPRYSFVGIYSSRVKDQETGEPIYGICWKKDAIEAVCANDAVPENPALVG